MGYVTMPGPEATAVDLRNLLHDALCERDGREAEVADLRAKLEQANKRSQFWKDNSDAAAADAARAERERDEARAKRDAEWRAAADAAFEHIQPNEALLAVFEDLPTAVIHEIWKRDPRVLEVQAEVERLTRERTQSEADYQTAVEALVGVGHKEAEGRRLLERALPLRHKDYCHLVICSCGVAALVQEIQDHLSRGGAR